MFQHSAAIEAPISDNLQQVVQQAVELAIQRCSMQGNLAIHQQLDVIDEGLKESDIILDYHNEGRQILPQALPEPLPLYHEGNGRAMKLRRLKIYMVAPIWSHKILPTPCSIAHYQPGQLQLTLQEYYVRLSLYKRNRKKKLCEAANHVLHLSRSAKKESGGALTSTGTRP
ncbi:hypothetical protein BDN67DRAFT_981511 [Paxillus ammoniavirescens]|nr:hypothetical protein BDN67DRAFT_981511 [Paxillus ammoniavirescens]